MEAVFTSETLETLPKFTRFKDSRVELTSKGGRKNESDKVGEEKRETDCERRQGCNEEK
jgi:hypothetical protein